MVDSRQRWNLNAAPPGGACCLRTGRTAAFQQEPSGTDECERFWDVPVALKRSSASSCLGGGSVMSDAVQLGQASKPPRNLDPGLAPNKGPFSPPLPVPRPPVPLTQLTPVFWAQLERTLEGGAATRPSSSVLSVPAGLSSSLSNPSIQASLNNCQLQSSLSNPSINSSLRLSNSSPRRRPAPISPLTLSPGSEQRRGLTKQLSPTMSPSLSPITQVPSRQQDVSAVAACWLVQRAEWTSERVDWDMKMRLKDWK